MYKNKTFCVHVHNLHPGGNLHPSANKLLICTTSIEGANLHPGADQILKTPFTWPKIHPRCIFAHGANCAHEHGLRKLLKLRWKDRIQDLEAEIQSTQTILKIVQLR